MGVGLTVGLACVLWFVTFYLSWSIFWIKISFSAATLAILSLWLQPRRADHFRFNKNAIIIGLVSAALLYLIFFTGKMISSAIFPFAQGQIGAIYGKGTGTPAAVIVPLLFLLPDPAKRYTGAAICKKTLWDAMATGKVGCWQQASMRRYTYGHLISC
jgi:hypothetical protein